MLCWDVLNQRDRGMRGRELRETNFCTLQSRDTFNALEGKRWRRRGFGGGDILYKRRRLVKIKGRNLFVRGGWYSKPPPHPHFLLRQLWLKLKQTSLCYYIIYSLWLQLLDSGKRHICKKFDILVTVMFGVTICVNLESVQDQFRPIVTELIGEVNERDGDHILFFHAHSLLESL